MNAVFHFHFYDPSDDFTPVRSLAFYATNMTTTWEQLDETIAVCAEDMDAKYGEHCALIGRSDLNTIGYASSHFEGTRQDQVMEAWRNVFVQRIRGCVVGDVCDITSVDNLNEIFQRVQDAYEQQQAQLLRDRLNEHVTTPQTAPLKKM